MFKKEQEKFLQSNQVQLDIDQEAMTEEDSIDCIIWFLLRRRLDLMGAEI